jgi:hypothetical protein
MTDEDLTNYNNIIQEFIYKKDEAMQTKVKYGDERTINYDFKNYKFNVLATTNRGFNVSIKNNDIFVSLRKIKILDSNPIIKVEFRAEYLTRCGYIEAIERVELFLKNLIPCYEIKISEIHLCADVQGHNFNLLDTYKFKTNSRSSKLFESTDDKISYINNKVFTGFSMGNGDYMMRIYNKSHEIDKFKNKAYIKPLKWDMNPKYNSLKDVWRIEFQIRRSKLKTIVGENGVLDGFEIVLNAIPDLWSMAIKQFSFRDLDNQHSIDVITGQIKLKDKFVPLTKDTLKKRFQNSSIHPIWNTLSTFNSFKGKPLSKHKEITYGSIQYVGNSIKALVSTLSKYNGGVFSSEILANTIEKVNQDNLSKHGLTILESGKLKMLDYLYKAKEYQNINGVVIDDFDLLEDNILNEIRYSYAQIENNSCSVQTFEEYYKKYQKVA